MRRRRHGPADVAARRARRVLELEVGVVLLFLLGGAALALREFLVGEHVAVPSFSSRCIGTPTISVPGHLPCRSGSPHAVRGTV